MYLIDIPQIFVTSGHFDNKILSLLVIVPEVNIDIKPNMCYSATEVMV